MIALSTLAFSVAYEIRNLVNPYPFYSCTKYQRLCQYPEALPYLHSIDYSFHEYRVMILAFYTSKSAKFALAFLHELPYTIQTCSD